MIEIKNRTIVIDGSMEKVLEQWMLLTNFLSSELKNASQDKSMPMDPMAMYTMTGEILKNRKLYYVEGDGKKITLWEPLQARVAEVLYNVPDKQSKVLSVPEVSDYDKSIKKVVKEIQNKEGLLETFYLSTEIEYYRKLQKSIREYQKESNKELITKGFVSKFVAGTKILMILVRDGFDVADNFDIIEIIKDYKLIHKSLKGMEKDLFVELESFFKES